MKCKFCGKDVWFSERVYRNLELYNPGGSVVVASKCCGKGYTIRMNISYTTTEYIGKKKEDDWGEQMHTKKKDGKTPKRNSRRNVSKS